MAVELTSKAATWNESIVALHGATDSRSAEQALTALETALANPSLDNASCRAELAEATASAQRKEWWTAALESQASSTAAIFQSPIEADLESGPSRGGGGGGGGGEVETRDAKDICGRICQAFRDPICFIAVWLVVFFGFLWRGRDINGHHVTRANIYRRVADLTHLLSFFVLLIKLLRQRTSAGVSIKTQEMLLLVFLSRYLDLFQHYVSLYNSIMKGTYIGLTAFTVLLVKKVEPWKSTYSAKNDTAPHYAFILGAAVLALLVHDRFTVMEVAWAFSIYLEAVAAIPQLLLLQKSGEVEKFMLSYLFLRGVYRALYIANWLTRQHQEFMYKIHVNAFIAAAVQTAPFVFFFIRIPKVKTFRRE